MLLSPAGEEREFKSAEELRSHYAGIKRKFDPSRSNRTEPPSNLPSIVSFSWSRERDVTPCADPNVIFEFLDGHRVGKRVATRVLAHLILRDVSNRYDMSRDEILSQRRAPPVVKARHELYYLLKKHTLWSLPKIGDFCEGRDHTTILHGIRAHCAKNNLPEFIAANDEEPYVIKQPA